MKPNYFGGGGGEEGKERGEERWKNTQLDCLKKYQNSDYYLIKKKKITGNKFYRRIYWDS